MKKAFTVILLLLTIVNVARSQNYGKFPYYISDTMTFVDDNNNPFTKMMSGGFNCPQFSPCDLNDDGKKDLVVYDKQDGSVTTYINKGAKGEVKYELDNRYAAYFPKMKANAWMLLRDYNRDGYEDLFTFEDQEYVIYKNISYTVSGRPAFERLPPVNYRNFRPTGSGLEYNRLSSPAMHLPGIYDIDFDGDLDIMSYSNVGGAITLWLNYQVENNKPNDSLDYYLVDICWGYFTDNNCNDFFLADCKKNSDYRLYGPRHTNGSSITLFDADNDKDIDLLIGNEGCNHMTMMYNAKKYNMLQYDSFYVYDTNFAVTNNRAEVSIYPAAYYLDVDNDGNRDIIYAPNSTTYQYYIEDINQIFWLKNTGSDSVPVWGALKQPLFTPEYIDLGKQSSWVFHDWDKDGDLDAIAANRGISFYSRDTADRICLFENIGTKQSPKFKRINTDFGGFRKLQIRDLCISVADLNHDGKADLICGNDKGEILFFQNTSSSDNTLNPSFKFANADFPGINIDIGYYSAPAVADINKDGLEDLVIGRSDSMLSYYRNSGSLSQPAFTLVTNRFGGIKAFDSISFNYIYDDTFAVIGYFPIYEKNTYSKPFIADLDGNDTLELILANSYGSLRIYEIDKDAPTSTFKEIDSFYYREVFQGVKMFSKDLGNFLNVTAADLNNDSVPELLVSNNRGGINYLKPNFSGAKNNVSIADIRINQINGFPNPANRFIEYDIRPEDVVGLEVYNNLGQLAEISNNSDGQFLRIDVSNLVSGFYVIRIKTASDKVYVSKFQIIH